MTILFFHTKNSFSFTPFSIWIIYFNIRAVSQENLCFAYVKIKAQISCAVTVQLISAFRYIDSIIPLLPKTLAIYCGCTACFVSELVGKKTQRQVFLRLGLIDDKLICDVCGRPWMVFFLVNFVIIFHS